MARPAINSIVNLLDRVFGNHRKKRCTKKTTHSIGFAHLSLEVLEERTVLAAAVGSFERLSGSVDTISQVTSNSWDTIFVQGLEDPPPAQTLTHSAAAAQVMDEGAFAFSHNQNTALVPTPIGAFIAVPQATTAGSYSFVVTGGGGIEITYTESSTLAGYEYHANPSFGDDLTLHRHLFLAYYGGEVAFGNAVIDNLTPKNLYASIGEFYASAQWVAGQWLWEVGYNGIPYLQDFSAGSQLNLHFIDETGIEDESVIGINTSQEVDFSADSYPDGHAQGLWNTSVGAWAYVTPIGVDVTPGDFNYDGFVDELDYQIWDEGLPQADANLDGIVDEHDYCIWAANVDGILVSTLADESDGDYSYGDLSLREALLLAADVNHPGPDIIAFDCSLLGGAITLNPSLGALNIHYLNEVMILGPGADQLAIDANGGSSMFVFLQGGNPQSSIVNLTLTGTSTSGTAVSQGGHNLVLDQLEIVGNGVGVRPGGNYDLTISNSTISENYFYGVARTSQSTNPTSGQLTITNSKIIDNGGYGIFIRSLDTEIFQTEIAGNNTRGLIGSGGIFYQSEETYKTLAITDSTIAENNGRGILVNYDADAQIYNTTISSNAGVGMSVQGATATLTNVTVTQNRVATSGATAGLYADTGATITMHNTIVAHNFSGTGGSEAPADLGKVGTGSFSVGTSSYNLIGVVGNSGITSSQSNIILGSSGDPGLTPLGDYGGRTRTHALLFDSLAIDAGDNAKAAALDLVFDQRGEGYDRIVDWDQDLDARVDIGAFEVALSEMFS